jgi:hypothetical protein
MLSVACLRGAAWGNISCMLTVVYSLVTVSVVVLAQVMVGTYRFTR